MSLMSWRPARARKGVPVGDVEGFHGDPAGEERRDLGPAVCGDDDLLAQAEQTCAAPTAASRCTQGDVDRLPGPGAAV